MPSRKRGPAAAAAATSSDEDSFDETPARGGRGKAAASAKPPAKPASGATLTIWTKRQMKGKLEGEIRSEIQHGATWEAFKELINASAQAMLDGWWTLDDDCKLFWLGRNKHGGKKVSEVHFLTGADDFKAMVKDATTTGNGGRKRRADSRDAGLFHIAIQLSDAAIAPTSESTSSTAPRSPSLVSV